MLLVNQTTIQIFTAATKITQMKILIYINWSGKNINAENAAQRHAHITFMQNSTFIQEAGPVYCC